MADHLFAWLTSSDGTLYFKGMRDSLEQAPSVYLTTGVTATVVAIRDAGGALVSGPAYPVAAAYVAGSDGLWAATIAYQSAFVKGRKYRAELRAVVGAKQRTRFVEFEVKDDVVRSP